MVLLNNPQAKKKPLPVFGPSHANCSICELKLNCDKGKIVPSRVPKTFNGIMVVGEGPGHHEVIEGRPFVGPSGRLLRTLFESYNVSLDDCYVTNATLCGSSNVPTTGNAKGGFHERFPNAVYACLPRLEAEIAHVRPRVVLAVGAAAMIAMTGYEERYMKRKHFACSNCDDDRKIGPVVECSKCKHRYWADEVPENCTAEQDTNDGGKVICGARLTKLKPKRVKCPVCKGLKTRLEEETKWEYDYKISEVAGAIFDEKQHAWSALGVKYIIPTLHPSYLLRNKADKHGGQFMAKAVQKHIRKAIRLSRESVDWSFEYEITDSFDDADAAKHVLDYIYSDGILRVSVDIETEAWTKDRQTQLDAREITEVSDITCVGFASRKKGYALVVDTRTAGPKLLEALKQVMVDENVLKTFHNGVGYDAPVIWKLWGVSVRGYVDDTLTMHHVLYPDEPHKLSHVAFSYTYARAWKPPKELKGREAHATFEDLAKYNARDVMITDEAGEEMLSHLKRKKLDKLYEFDMRNLNRQALAMFENGMNVDRDSAVKVGREALARANESLGLMREFLSSSDFNPNSSKQLGWALYSKLGYTPTAHTKGGAPATSAVAVKGLPDSPFKQALLGYSEANAVLKAYFEINEKRTDVTPSRGMYIWPDGRLRAVWKPWARTGRFTTNPNLQNWPGWMRKMITAPEGRKIFGADYDQLELRILAALSGDEALIDKCLSADETRKLEPECDPHSYAASFAFGETFVKLALNDSTHDKGDLRCRCETCTRKALRDLVKRVFYGLNYGAGDEKVLESIYQGGYTGPALTLQMVARSRQAIFTAFKRIQPYQNNLIKEAYANGYVSSAILGRQRIFPLNDIPVTEIKNFIIQSTGADIINLRNTIVFEGIRKIDPTAMYLAQVHDAVYYEGDERREEELKAFITESLTWETALYKGGPKMRFSAVSGSGDDWKSSV